MDAVPADHRSIVCSAIPWRLENSLSRKVHTGPTIEESMDGVADPSFVSLGKPLLLYGVDDKEEGDYKEDHYIHLTDQPNNNTITRDEFYLEVQSAVRWYSVPIGFFSQISQLSGLAYVSQLNEYYTNIGFDKIGGIEKGLYCIVSVVSRIDIFILWMTITMLYMGARDCMMYLHKIVTNRSVTIRDDLLHTMTERDMVTIGIQFHLGYLIGIWMAWLIVIVGYLFITSGGTNGVIVDLTTNIAIAVLGSFSVLYAMTKLRDLEDEEESDDGGAAN